MSKGHFYTFPESASVEVESNNCLIPISENNENNEENYFDSEFLQDVPYSSSSIDRSSIGSIPWADDAIKRNQLDWEHVQRMLCGEDVLPTESDLRNEILEWQKKFPLLVTVKMYSKMANKHPTASQQKLTDTIKEHAPQLDSLEAELISNLSLHSFDNCEDDDQYDPLTTPTATLQPGNILKNPTGTTKSSNEQLLERLSAKLSFLRINALPLRTTQRNSDSAKGLLLQSSTERDMSDSPNSMSSHKKLLGKQWCIQPSVPLHPNSGGIKDRTRIRMPPILNVLESKRRFRDLANNKSFVQLTRVKVPQVKSAAIIRQAESTLPIGKQSHVVPVASGQYQSVWHKPLIAARVSSNFFNNRNTIILPALNLQRNSGHQRTNNRTAFDINTTGPQSISISNSTNDSSAGSKAPLDISRPVPSTYIPRWQQFSGITTPTSTGTVSTGRSISAAMHHPRHEFGELYTPYSMYKHDGLK